MINRTNARLGKAAILLLIAVSHVELANGEEGKHLFILSGQSNMAGLDPQASFIPAVGKALGKDRVIVVKFAKGGQPIRRWYRDWKSSRGVESSNNGDLYQKLMQRVEQAVGDQKLKSVTFVWMQGERDAKTKEHSVYGESLKGVVEQIVKDLEFKDINVVVGRLGKGQLTGKPWSKDWASLRKVQEELCSADPNWEMVDCDDLELRNDQLHFSKDGYKQMGNRFAEKAIKLVKADSKR